MMKNVVTKKICTLIVFYFIASRIVSFAQSPNFKEVTDAAIGASDQIKILLTWLLGIAGGIGSVIVAFKLFSGKPDAKEGIMYWVGGVIFCLAAAVVIGTIQK